MFNLDDISVVRGGGSSFQADVDDTTTSSGSQIQRGEVVKRSNANFVLQIADGDPEVGTDILAGIANSPSTETSTADGKVELTQILPSTLLRGRATTASNINSAANLLGVKFDYVAFDVTSSAQTIDENELDDPNVHGLCILDGDIVAGTLDVLVHMMATLSANTV